MDLLDNPQDKEAMEEYSANYGSPSFGSQNFLKVKLAPFLENNSAIWLCNVMVTAAETHDQRWPW